VPLKLKAGNIREKPIREIWENSPVFLELRSLRNRDLKECASCPEKKTCSRCMAMSNNENGDKLGCSLFARDFAMAFSRAQDVQHAQNGMHGQAGEQSNARS
jgi:radical SAM protein with 4Fe4S-binding SPASM domain